MAVHKVVKRILHKKAPGNPPPVQETPVVHVEKKEGLCTECGEPVAEGQTYVCRSHIRRG